MPQTPWTYTVAWLIMCAAILVFPFGAMGSEYQPPDDIGAPRSSSSTGTR